MSPLGERLTFAVQRRRESLNHERTLYVIVIRHLSTLHTENHEFNLLATNNARAPRALRFFQTVDTLAKFD